MQLQVQAARDQMQTQMQAASAHSAAQLASANAQILYFSQMLEAVRADQERLRRESEAAFTSFESRTQGRTGGMCKREVSLVNMKVSKEEDSQAARPRAFKPGQSVCGSTATP